MPKHGSEGVSMFLLFGDTQIFTICHVHASKWLRQVRFFTFLVIVGIKIFKKRNMSKLGLEGIFVVW